MLAAALTVSLLSASPSSASGLTVLVARRTGVSVERGKELALAVTASLAASGFNVALMPDAALKKLASVGVKDTAICEGKRPCLAEIGRQLQVDLVVGVAASEIQEDMSVYVEAIATSDAASVAKDGFVVPAGAVREVSAGLAPFLEALRKALVPAGATTPVASGPGAAPPSPDSPTVGAGTAPDAPVAGSHPVLTPSEGAPDPLLVSTRSSRMPSVAAAGGAVVALGLAAYFGANAMTEKGRLARADLDLGGNQAGSTLRGSDALARNQTANAELVGALAAGVLGLGLEAAALALDPDRALPPQR